MTATAQLVVRNRQCDDRGVLLRVSNVTFAPTPTPLADQATTYNALSGRHELLKRAVNAARQPASGITHPRYAYTKTMGWYFGARVGGQATTSVVIPSTTQSWVAPDGGTHVHRVFINRADGNRSVDDFTYAKGPVPRQLSTNEAMLARQLAVRRGPCFDQPGQRDRSAGRRGVAVALDSTYSRLLTRRTLTTIALVESASRRARGVRPGPWLRRIANSSTSTSADRDPNRPLFA